MPYGSRAATSPSSSATACWPTSAGRGRTRTTPSAPCAPASPPSRRWPGWTCRGRGRRPPAPPAPVGGGGVRGEGGAAARAGGADPPTLAPRLQTLAEPGAVALDDATRRL